MYNIALIGAGSLGRRHIEGLLKLPQENSIWVVDPSRSSLDAARNLPALMNDSSVVGRVKFETSIDRLPDKLDYVVIATSADVRRGVIEALLQGRTIRSMLLEKVLFQRQEDYPAITALIAQAGVRTWVNTVRRAVDTHQSIKQFFEGETISWFDVRGGEWGLGCNGIHFLDFLSFLSGVIDMTVSTEALDRSTLASKRPGFVEFTGTLRGHLGPTEFALSAGRGSSAPLLVTIRSENKSCILDEASGYAFLRNHKAEPVWRELRFRFPFISELSTKIANDILQYGESHLPDFSASSALHLPFIAALADFCAEYCEGTPGLAPIT